MAPGRGPLRIALEDFLNTFGFGKRVQGWAVAFMELLEDGLVNVYASLVNSFGVADSLPPHMRPDAIRTVVKTSQSGILVAIVSITGFITGGFSGWGSIYARKISYYADNYLRTYIPSVLEIPIFKRRDPARKSVYDQALLNLGVEPAFNETIDKVTEQVLPPLQLEALRLRELISEAEYNKDMLWNSITPERVTQIQNIAKLIPGPSDLVSMAVREAWSDETVNRFKYDAGFDDIPDFTLWMKRQGYSEEWTRRYWRAHWQLPGVNQVYEMLHRLRSGANETTLDDVRLFLKTADIPEYWRDRLIAISYAPYTRIDIRRMWKLNILSDQEVYDAHRDIGYDDDHAKKLTQFVTADQSSDKTDLTRAAIIQAYKRGLQTKDKAKQGLIAIGLSEADATFYLSLADYDMEAEMTDVQISVIQAKYVNGILSDSELAGALGALNLPSERMTALTTLWTIQRNNKTAVASRAENDDLLRRAIIDHATYKANLKRDGYETKTIDWFVTRIDQIIDADASAEAAAQQAEQERLGLATKKTSYQVDRQNLVVQIAQLRTAIADIVLAQHTVTDPDQLLVMADTVTEYKNIIVHIQEQIATLKLDFLTPPTP